MYIRKFRRALKMIKIGILLILFVNFITELKDIVIIEFIKDEYFISSDILDIGNVMINSL